MLENDTTAKIADNASLTLASGDLSVEATATNSYDAASKATVGKEAGLFAGIDAALSGSRLEGGAVASGAHEPDTVF